MDNAMVPMQVEIEEGQRELAKRLKPRRGYCLDTENGGWYEGNVSEKVGTGKYKMNHDNYATVHQVPADHIVADGDVLFITYEEAADPDPDLIFQCEVSLRDDGTEKDVVCLVNPQPQWEVDELGVVKEYTLLLNPRTQRQREAQPHFAHSREALDEKLAAVAAESLPDPSQQVVDT